jgi:trehalose-phosphatase
MVTEQQRPFMLDTLVEVVAAVKERIATADRISLFLDFDGTLVPIQADPALPRLDVTMAKTLQSLSGRDRLVTTIISGRAIEDLYSRVRLKGLIYAGNHGLEIFGRNLRFIERAAAARQKQLEQLCEELRGQLQPFDGVLVEFKGLTASVHYRKAAESALPAVETIMLAAVAREGRFFHMNQGLKVFEILPRTGWHKGAAVRWINGQLGEGRILSIYLGDDTTDEDAFSVLPDAITIKVGSVPVTCARYRLPDPTAVQEFLLWLSIQTPLT